MPSKLRCGLLLAALSCVLMALEITPAGAALASRFDAMEVEKHWLPGRHVDWRTGDPDNGRVGKTHCSSFVAAACERMGIYILRPPAHGHRNLANAQFRWLSQEGGSKGWRPVDCPLEAQCLANDGQVVVAVYLNPNPRISGHIGLVRPSWKPRSDVLAEGPQIIQAGGSNYNSTTTKQGFRRHRGAWVDATRHQLGFFVHLLPGASVQ